MQLADWLAKNERFDLWRYQEFLGELDPVFWVSDQRSSFTRLEKKADNLWIKHEDEHPIGSHKGRSVAYQLSILRSRNVKKVVLSSSGNAAIALAKLNQFFSSFVFVSPHIDNAKGYQLSLQQSEYTKVISTPFPRNFAQYLAKKEQYWDLRPSQSDDAIRGLMTLGFELAEQIADLSDQYSIYAVTTSGANVLGMYKSFCLLQSKGLLATLPKIFPVLISDYQGGTLTRDRCLALESAAFHTGGNILEHSAVDKGDHQTSFEGNTAFAAYQQNHRAGEKAVVIFTGKKWDAPLKPYSLPQYATIQAFRHDYLL